MTLHLSFLFSVSLTLIDALDTLLVCTFLSSLSYIKFVIQHLWQWVTKWSPNLVASICFFQILGNHTEFQRVATLLQDTVDFDIDVNASVFETNIRGEITGNRFKFKLWKSVKQCSCLGDVYRLLAVFVGCNWAGFLCSGGWSSLSPPAV